MGSEYFNGNKRFIVTAVIFLLVLVLLVGCTNRLQQRIQDKKDILQTNELNFNTSDNGLEEYYKPGNYEESITHNGITRTYLMHIPKNFDFTKEYPLILSFHGGSGTSERQAKRGFSEKADELALENKDSYIVVYPQGINGNWNDGRDSTNAYEKGIDDIDFVKELIEHLKNKLPIDEEKIFANGISNGGFMSYRLGCELSNIFAGIAPVVSAMPENLMDSCDATPVSLVAIQGVEDPFIPIEGGDTKHKTLGLGDGGLAASSIETEKLWVNNNKCNNAAKVELLPIIVDDGTSVTKTSYANCAENTKINFYRVEGMGHQWPPREGLERMAGPTSKNIDAVEVIVDFLLE